MTKHVYAFKGPFSARHDLRAFKDNALLLFALEMRFDLEDIQSVAAQALTDGYDDKKCDLVYVDSNNHTAIVAQGYYSQGSNKQSAPANKASDLNTAATWLLSMELNSLPVLIKDAARELRDALNSKQVETIEFWYVHNLPESPNVERELEAVVTTAKNTLSSKYPEVDCNIRHIEVGLNTLEEWYTALQTPILVNDSFSIPIPGGYRLDTSEWSAYSTAIPAAWLFNIFQHYGEKLFSANYRGYLGSRRSDNNINHGIKQSASHQPDKFWAFNNGITALVNEFHVKGRSRKKIAFSGLSIVNGAQTTGAIGSLSSCPSGTAMVPARFIKCHNPKIVQDIVEFNNSQNELVSADFRSNDKTQKRLRKEFTQYHGNILYMGGKRGGTQDKITRNPNLISSDTVAQALAAFHGMPNEAYNGKSLIWKEDRLYHQFFNDHTHAAHIIFVYALHSIISSTKLSLLNKIRAGELLTSSEQSNLEFLRMRGSTYLLMAALGSCIGVILDKPITDKFLLRFNDNIERAKAEALWMPVVDICLAFNESLRKPLDNGLKGKEEIESAISSFSMFLKGTRVSNHSIYSSFASHVSVVNWSQR